MMKCLTFLSYFPACVMTLRLATISDIPGKKEKDLFNANAMDSMSTETETETVSEFDVASVQWMKQIKKSAVTDEFSEFVEWRYGAHANRSTNSKSHVWAADMEFVYGNVFQEKNMKKCSMAVPQRPNGVDTRHHARGTHGMPKYYWNETDESTTDFLNAVDQIYVICISCRRVFPEKLKNKVWHIDGKLSDRCLGVGGNHWSKAEAAHRLAITHAKLHGYKHAAIFEEDVIFQDSWVLKDGKMEQRFDFGPIKELINDDERRWEIIRLNWYDVEKVGSKCGECSLKKWITQNMGTMDRPVHKKRKKQCPLHSSAGYILAASQFDRFLNSRGIDSGMINQFDQTIMVPNLCHQIAYPDEKKVQKYYRDSIVACNKGKKWEGGYMIPDN